MLKVFCFTIFLPLCRPGTGKIWTVEGDNALEEQEPNREEEEDFKSLSPSTNTEGLSDADTKILLEKESNIV